MVRAQKLVVTLLLNMISLKNMVIFETDPENMYVRKPRRTNNGKAEEKKIPDDYIEYYI